MSELGADPRCADPRFTDRDTRHEKRMQRMREFESGATRDSDDGKLDYEGFLSPMALERYAEYMHSHRVQSDGNLRDSDNWQQGMPKSVYVKSMFRHFMDVWMNHRGIVVVDKKDGHTVDTEEALCGLIFNAFGLLRELVKPNIVRK